QASGRAAAHAGRGSNADRPVTRAKNRRVILNLFLLLSLGVALVGCGSARSYTVSAVKQAFTRAGLHDPRVQKSPPGVVFNYGRPPHVVSVTVYKQEIPVVFVPTRGMRVTHLGNVMVWYSVTKSEIVKRALDSLK